MFWKCPTEACSSALVQPGHQCSTIQPLKPRRPLFVPRTSCIKSKRGLVRCRRAPVSYNTNPTHRFEWGGGILRHVGNLMILIYLVLSSYLPNSVSGLKRSPPLLLARSPARKRISRWKMNVMRWGRVHRLPPTHHHVGRSAVPPPNHPTPHTQLPCGTSCSTSLAGASAAQWTILAVEDRLSTM